MDTRTLPPAAAGLADGRARLLAGGECGRPYETAHTRLFDEYFTRRLEEEPSLLPKTPFLLLAQGGYGRGRLSPGSDIDICVLFEGDVPTGGGPGDAEPLAKALFYPLWDLGLTIDYSLRSLDETLRLVRTEPKVMAALLEARPLCGTGGEPLWLRFRSEFLKVTRGPARLDFLDWLARLDGPKAAERGDGASLLEPNLKEGPGGLRDWQQIGWLAALFPGREGASLFDLGLLEPGELFALAAAAERVASVRCGLHRVTGRRQDVLYFELQEGVAQALGEGGDDGHEAAARLLTGLQPAMSRVRLAREAMAREVEGRLGMRSRVARPAAAGGLTGSLPGSLPDGLADTPGGLGFVEDPSANPALALALFETAAATGRMPCFSGQAAVRRCLEAAARRLRGGVGLFHWLPRMLSLPHGREAGRIMLELGLLGALVPELGAVQHLVQRDGFHRFPVGRHSLRAARLLARAGQAADEAEGGGAEGETPSHPLLDQAVAEAPDREILIWTGLLHDAGKGGPDHEIAGESLVRAALSRMGVSPARIEESCFLVRHHLLLMATATRRDLGDVATATRVAETVGDPGRLSALTALAVADAMATGPVAWSGWKAALLRELTHKVERLLRTGALAEPLAGRQVMERRERVRALALSQPQRVDASLVESFLDALPPDCLLRLPPQTVRRHLGLYERYRAAYAEDQQLRPGRNAGLGLTVHTARLMEAPEGSPSLWEFAVMAPDQPRLFATLAGCISLHGASILAADIFTLGDGTALDVFVAECPDDKAKSAHDWEETWAQVALSVRWAQTGKLSLDYRIAERRASPYSRQPRGTGREPSVRIDNELSDFFTVVEVTADDRLGRLYDIADTLADAGVWVHSAKISTHGGQILDVFMVRGPGGLKLQDDEVQERLRAALLTRLGG